MKLKYRVRVRESWDKPEYLVDKVIESKLSPKAIVKIYIQKHPGARLVEAKEINEFRTNSYSRSYNA